jgi:putative transposase
MGRLTHRTSPGWTYFVTTKAWQNVSVFQVQETAEVVVSKIFEYRDKGNYLLHEFVLMPNHLHLILTPEESISLEKAIQLIKGGSSHEIHRVRENKMQIWQSGFHESMVRDWVDYKRKADYIRFNPVAAGLVECSEEWPNGSANGKYKLDPIPQGLKPLEIKPRNVGPKGPTPTVANAAAPNSAALTPAAAKAHRLPSTETPELKVRPPKEQHL